MSESIMWAGLGILLVAVVLFGYPAFCMLKRFWGWKNLWWGN